MKTAAVIIAVIGGFVGLGLLGSALNLITIPWLKFDSQVQMNRDIVTKTYSADNALYNYHWFQETAGEIKATDAKIADAQSALADFETSAGPRKDWSFDDKTEDARLRSVYQGLKSYYNSTVQEYNAKAAEQDKSMFVDGLPTFFSLKPF